MPKSRSDSNDFAVNWELALPIWGLLEMVALLSVPKPETNRTASTAIARQSMTASPRCWRWLSALAKEFVLGLVLPMVVVGVDVG